MAHAFARKQQQRPDLGGEILRLRGQIEAFIDGKVAELKRGRDGEALPSEMLRRLLVKNQTCWCRAALDLLGEESK